MIIIITGNGKGKTTSGIGQAIRSAGQNKKTAIIFFDKGGNFYGEQVLLDKISEIDVFRFGLERFDEKNQKFRFKNTLEDTKEAMKATEKILDLYKQNYFLIVADEFLNALNIGLLSEEKAMQIVDLCPKSTNLYLTGRNVPDWLAKKADLLSEVRNIKHYFNEGAKAQRGIEY